MTDKAVSPLRRRMIEHMTIRKFVAKTQHDYVQRVKNFAVFLGRSPATASKEDVRRFQLHLASNGAGTPKMNATAAALRFFFNVTLDRPDLAKQASFVHGPRKVPVVLSSEEVARFLEAAPGIKYKAALSVAYGAGLRVSEVAALKVTDINSKRMMLRVEQGKGRKDRYAMLSPQLLELLRDWYRVARPQGWLFPGRDRVNPMTTRQLRRGCEAAAQAAKISKRVIRPFRQVADTWPPRHADNHHSNPYGASAHDHSSDCGPCTTANNGHSITSSAVICMISGTVRPSALAVLRLMTSSYLVGACTGMSAGFSPLRMRSTYEAERRTMSALSGP
jgi:integrase/recombinase XerD